MKIIQNKTTQTNATRRMLMTEHPQRQDGMPVSRRVSSSPRARRSRSEKPQISRRQRCIIQRISIALMLVVMLVPAAMSNFKPQVMSEADNRYLAERPVPGQIREELEDYLSDRVGFRAQLLAGYALFNDKLFGLMTHPLFEYGKDRWTFFAFSGEPKNLNYIRHYAEYVKRVQDFCEARNVPFLYVISPEKSRVYAEYVPDYVPPLDNASDYLKEYFDELGVTYLDQYDALIERKAQGYEVFNQVYDPGHWNTEGMYAGSQAIIDALQAMGLNVEDIDLADYHKIEAVRKTMPSSKYPINAKTYTYIHNDDGTQTTYLAGYLDDLMMNDTYFDRSYHVNESKSEAPSLLMFQGSYFNTLGTMLQHQFSRSAHIHDYENIFALEYYYSVFQPDVVVFENADYTLIPAYYGEGSLINKQFYDPPSTSELARARYAGAITAVVEKPSDTIFNFLIDLPAGRTGLDNEGAWIRDVSGRMFDLYSKESGRYLWGMRVELVDSSEPYTLYIRNNGRIYLYDVELSLGEE